MPLPGGLRKWYLISLLSKLILFSRTPVWCRWWTSTGSGRAQTSTAGSSTRERYSSRSREVVWSISFNHCSLLGTWIIVKKWSYKMLPDTTKDTTLLHCVCHLCRFIFILPKNIKKIKVLACFFLSPMFVFPIYTSHCDFIQ